MPAYNTYKSTMKKNTFLILSLLLLYLYPLSASVEIRSNKLTTGDGLANNSTRYMMQDSKGFIWLGTLNGLSYYDGNSFVNIYPDINNPLSLADSRIRSMEEDPNGFMWISTISSFISCYDLRHGCFVDFTEMGNTRKTIPNSLSFPTTLFGYGIIKTVAAESFIRTANFHRKRIKRNQATCLPIKYNSFWKVQKEKSGLVRTKGY